MSSRRVFTNKNLNASRGGWRYLWTPSSRKGEEPARKHYIQPGCRALAGWHGTGRPNLSLARLNSQARTGTGNISNSLFS